MRRIMSDDLSQELHDPALSALLREAYRDEDALVDAPERTARIMRRLRASRPPRRPAPWTAWVYASCASGLAAAAVLLTLRLTPSPVTISPGPPSMTARVPAPTPASTPRPAPAPPRQRPDAVLVDPGEASSPTWVTHTPLPAPVPLAPTASTAPTLALAPGPAPASSEDSATVAAALYSAGSVAQVAGDFEAAYTAYHASYETMPTPDAILASGRALQAIAQETLASDG
jgi:hypothetical protein